jgi:DNA-binding response OmpR family regulator
MSARILVVDDSPTIRKVVASILKTRSYEPVLAEDGRAALDMLQSENVDLILLDFVMPRMNGYQFCRELRNSDSLKGLPVVLMSAKGDKIRGQFGLQTGAVDAITKPFDARGLIAVVESALKRSKEGRVVQLSDVDVLDDDDWTSESHPSLSADPAVRRGQAAAVVSTAIEEVLVPVLTRRAAKDIIGYRTAIQEAVTAATVERLSLLLRSVDLGEKHHEVLSGDLSVISIAEVLQLLALQRQSGALSVFNRRTEITLFVNNGDVDFGAWKGLRDEFLLGRLLVASGAVSRETLQQVLDSKGAGQRLLGETLVQQGHATEQQIKTALVQQTSELVYELARWNKGRFGFHIGVENPIAQKAQLGLPSGALVMEGFRRTDEWRLIEGSFDFDEVLHRDQGAIERVGAQSKLTKRERAVLQAIDGERTVREIVDQMGGSSFELCKILYQFLNSRLVRRQAA